MGIESLIKRRNSVGLVCNRPPRLGEELFVLRVDLFAFAVLLFRAQRRFGWRRHGTARYSSDPLHRRTIHGDVAVRHQIQNDLYARQQNDSEAFAREKIFSFDQVSHWQPPKKQRGRLPKDFELRCPIRSIISRHDPARWFLTLAEGGFPTFHSGGALKYAWSQFGTVVTYFSEDHSAQHAQGLPQSKFRLR
jgi:hypothetical protein